MITVQISALNYLPSWSIIK